MFLNKKLFLDSDDAIKKLGLEAGNNVLYKSNGLHFSFEKYDTTTEIIRRVTKIINS